MPTRPGWWWTDRADRVTGEAWQEIEEIERRQGHGGLWTYYGRIDGDDWPRELAFLAPVPSPAVCAALATLADRLAEFDAREGEEPHAFGEQASGMFRGLLAALRAEREGGGA